jgi:hypothetical protein
MVRQWHSTCIRTLHFLHAKHFSFVRKLPSNAKAALQGQMGQVSYSTDVRCHVYEAAEGLGS